MDTWGLFSKSPLFSQIKDRKKDAICTTSAVVSCDPGHLASGMTRPSRVSQKPSYSWGSGMCPFPGQFPCYPAQALHPHSHKLLQPFIWTKEMHAVTIVSGEASMLKKNIIINPVTEAIKHSTLTLPNLQKTLFAMKFILSHFSCYKLSFSHLCNQDNSCKWLQTKQLGWFKETFCLLFSEACGQVMHPSISTFVEKKSSICNIQAYPCHSFSADLTMWIFLNYLSLYTFIENRFNKI